MRPPLLEAVANANRTHYQSINIVEHVCALLTLKVRFKDSGVINYSIYSMYCIYSRPSVVGVVQLGFCPLCYYYG